MSIPKEPRQLMINLMYLVLTALLALNISAEVMNAFFSMDKKMTANGGISDAGNQLLMGAINKQADAYKKDVNEKYRGNAKQSLEVAKEFVAYIQAIRDDLMVKAKGPSKKDPTIPEDIRNKDITTDIFINKNKGDEIMAKIEETRKKLLALADNDPETEKSLSLIVDQIPAGSEAKSWKEYKFKQMPVAAVWPILGQMQTDAKVSANAVLNYCLKKVGGEDFKVDAFEPAVSAEKSYIIAGEKYVADVYLSAYSTTAGSNITMSAGGSGLAMKDGKGHYEITPQGIGEKSYTVSINVKNPLTNETKNYTKEFKYEVGQRSVAVSLDKMNVFYIGVVNPITVSAAGVSSNDVSVTGAGAGINVTKKGGGKYDITVSSPGEASLTVAGGGASSKFTYRVKRIPDPTACVGGNIKNRGGLMGNGEFKAQGGISAILENFDFEVKCDLVGFETTYLKKRQDPSPPTANSGARFNEKTLSMIRQAAPGDAYFFDEIRAKCPGDSNPRNLGSIAYKIK